MTYFKTVAWCVLAVQSSAAVVFESQGTAEVVTHQAKLPGLLPSRGPGYTGVLREALGASTRKASAAPGSPDHPWRHSSGPGPLRTGVSKRPGAGLHQGLRGGPRGPGFEAGLYPGPLGAGRTVDYSRTYGRVVVVNYQPFTWTSRTSAGSARRPASHSGQEAAPSSKTTAPASSRSSSGADPGEDPEDDDDK